MQLDPVAVAGDVQKSAPGASFRGRSLLLCDLDGVAAQSAAAFSACVRCGREFPAHGDIY